MFPGFARLFLALVITAAATACKAVLKPSDKTRHASYARNKQLFTGNGTASLRATYFVFSVDSHLPQPSFDRKTRKVRFGSSKNTTVDQGLAVGLREDGYLLTAAHVLGKTNYIYGWFDGEIDLKPARVVFKSDPKTHADFALVKTEANLNQSVHFSQKTKVGEPAFAVVCYPKKTKLGGTLDFAAGTVLNVSRDPSGSLVDLIDTDLPLWEGDSGGPILSTKGELIGVTTGFEIQWRGLRWKYRRLGVLPDKQFIDHLIAEDRTAHQTPNHAPQRIVPPTRPRDLRNRRPAWRDARTRGQSVGMGSLSLELLAH